MADVNTSHISNIENNRVKISLPTLVHVCNALDITVDYVLSTEYNDTLSAIDREILCQLRLCPVKTKEQILKKSKFCNDFSTLHSIISFTAYRNPKMNPFSSATIATS